MKKSSSKTASKSKHGRPEKYTKELILGLVAAAKKAGVSLKEHVQQLAVAERSKLTPSQRKKKFHPTVSYVPMLVAAARVGISLRQVMKKVKAATSK